MTGHAAGDSEKPVSTSKSESSPSKDKRFKWLARAVPAFHCLLIGVAFTLASFRYFVTDANDKYQCNAMLNDGQWLDEGLSGPTSVANWQPDGCMLANYGPKEISSCLSGRTVLFAGDSIVRKLFFSALNILDPSIDTDNIVKKGGKHGAHTFVAGGVTLEFIWDPYLNSSRTMDILDGKDKTQTGKDGQPRPALFVLGCGLWALREIKGEAATNFYIERIERIIKATSPTSKNYQKKGQIADEVVLIPVERLTQSKLNADRLITLPPQGISDMNAELRKRLPPYQSSEISDVSVLYALNEVVSTRLSANHTNDGVHFDRTIVETELNLVLNLRCNDLKPKKFPFDTTCCTQYPAPNWVQIMIMLFALIWAPLGTHYYASNGRPFYSRFFPAQHVLLPMTIFGLSCVFMYFTDRTSLYLKIQKQFDFWPFTIAMVLALALGLATLKKPEEDLGFLNRDQTDEWKGWMQIAILIYHYYLASRVSGIYNPIRVLVAAYLFMTGYGHFSFYYKKADFGLARVAGVLIRLNLLTLALAYIQDTDYLSYYFSPLVTVWFGVIWVTMYIGYNHNKNTYFMLTKIVISAALTSAFHLHGKPLEFLFGIFNAVFKTQWNSKEWAFRVTLDMYIVYVGMLAALAFIKIQEGKIWDKSWWPRVRTLSYLAALAGLVGYFAFELRHDKFDYNRYHPYISFVPVLSFVVLRNATPLLRSTSSKAYIWIGRCSLETFICQFHLWLAGDTKGLLVLLPWPRLRFLNMIFTTLIFIFVSNQIATTTGQITEWICGKEPKKSANLPTMTSASAQYMPLNPLDGPETSVDITTEGEIVEPVPSTMEKLLSNLKFRCAVFMGLIWMLNLLYPNYHPSQGHLLPTH